MRRICSLFLIAVGLTSLALCSNTATSGKAAESPTVPTKADSKTAQPSLQATSLDKLIRVWLKIPTLRHSTIGLEIMELPGGKVLYCYNGNKRFTPASTTKAITCACALEELGPDFQYRTMLVGEGALATGRLAGNLQIVPSQDPTMSRADLSRLVSDAVARAASTGSEPLRIIDGTVQVTGPPGSQASFPSCWLVEDWGRYWMPVASNLVIDRNISHPSQFPGGYKTIPIRPAHGALFDRLLSSRYGPSWLYIDQPHRQIRVYKSFHPQAPDGGAFVVSNPDSFNAALVHSMLDQRKIKVLGKSEQVTSSGNVYQLAQHLSQPLPAILRRTLHKSDNLYAQQLLRTLGVQLIESRKGKLATSYHGTPISLEDRGLQSISRWLSKVGVPATEAILFDGCGLSRKNGVSPHALNLVMKHMAGEKLDGLYLKLLKENNQTSIGKGVYRYKTGTMDTVRAITGTMTTAGGQHLALTIMVNSHTPTVRSLKIAMSALINQLMVIKGFAGEPTKIQPGADNDPDITSTTNQGVLLDRKLLHKTPKRSSKKRRHRRRH